MSRRQRSRALARHGDVETAAEALDRYYAEESNSQGGLFTAGGATAGGIFGDGQIVTDQLDGPSVHRHLGAVRAAGLGDEIRRELAQSRKVQERLLKRLGELERRQLSGKSRGRRRRDEEEDELDDDELDDEDY